MKGLKLFALTLGLMTSFCACNNAFSSELSNYEKQQVHHKEAVAEQELDKYTNNLNEINQSIDKIESNGGIDKYVYIVFHTKFMNLRRNVSDLLDFCEQSNLSIIAEDVKTLIDNIDQCDWDFFQRRMHRKR